MGKRIIAQRRGKGSPTYRCPEHRIKERILYKNKPGKVVDIVNDPKRDAPLAKIWYNDGTYGYLVAPEGLKIGDKIHDFVMPLSKIQEGSTIFAIETYPNSGPKLCRTSGSSAILISKTNKECVIELPSKKSKKLSLNCRASIGKPAGEGRHEKPFVKAGKRWIAMHARGKLYPRTSGVAMNAVDHPFGGGYTGLGRPKSVSRNAPPGAKVGSISSRRTGRKKR
jgi:large subunit ribosomal protein L2